MNYNFDSKDYNDNVVSYYFHYYNFSYFENNFKFKNAFHYAYEFGHYKFVEILLNENLITNTEESALDQLNELAIDLKSRDISSFEEDMLRVCFILCNTYNKPEYKLGVGPINDSITVAANHKRMGYTVYFLHNPTSDVFLEYLVLFLTKTTQYLTVYYTGHGANVKDTSGDEEDGLDEVMVFDENYILDDLLAEILKENANGTTKVVLLNDCCHSGTLWDIPLDIEDANTFPANIICLSTAYDDEQAKQGRQGLNDQGFIQKVKKNQK